MPKDFIVTDDMVKAYQKAWHETPQGAPGDRTRAGLKAALDATWTKEDREFSGED